MRAWRSNSLIYLSDAASTGPQCKKSRQTTLPAYAPTNHSAVQMSRPSSGGYSSARAISAAPRSENSFARYLSGSSAAPFRPQLGRVGLITSGARWAPMKASLVYRKAGSRQLPLRVGRRPSPVTKAAVPGRVPRQRRQSARHRPLDLVSATGRNGRTIDIPPPQPERPLLFGLGQPPYPAQRFLLPAAGDAVSSRPSR